ncbi:hypothetical protein GJU43_14855 [Flavobacterium sp. LC2016-23]|uniref:hypothetical protein n=1 Tax=Flavobacterium sp. LC2016-23 TaxID=2666330 RepID=UPI0012B0B656|nr:hypothetical protein [Flavobacterium sp. LC2016-23]MRX40566.1 hypothetical protein [Flavobacterium sp. LC2016-23]
MISIIKSPALNRVLLDANNTEIQIESTNGDGFYFRALIYVDDVLFDEQGWSRKDSYTASKDLVKLYNAYFETILTVFQENGLVEQVHLKKKINITIQELSLETDEISDSISLPQFFFLFNVKPVYFDDSTKIQILGVTPPVILVPENGKIIVPFYVKALGESVDVKLYDNFGNLINAVTSDTFTDKKIFLYFFDLSPIILVKDTLYFELKIMCGLTEITRIYKLIRFPDFTVKEIYFKNNFGYYIPAYFDGELEIQDSFSVEKYTQSDGTSEIFEINEEATYTLNTASLLQNERAIVNQIASSHEVLIRINNQWRKIQPDIKKLLEYRDKKHLYAQELVFTFTKNGKVSNVFDTEAGADWDYPDFSPQDWLT